MKCAMKYFEKIEESRKPKGDNMEVPVSEIVATTDINGVDELASPDTNIPEKDKPVRIGKKKKNNEESEQID